ncbi:hypothetical protein ACFSC6_12140 [Rufibacter sediminis]|uniref:Uncharacterized protein n=1 Tax=Rufibacter sediminis TaxID=2762756 RepID=A0ABR6VTU8_9BACT|nr:hypothetical protein [Rufibacter sediminis]MBC3540633.1 hypothetical protein [Rufibacter sediminis]
MGDRALIIFHDKAKKEFSPVIYLHWAGYKVKDYIKETQELMADRLDDVSYAAARFIGICHSHEVSNLSLGIWNLPKGFSSDNAYLKNMSHGDRGVFLVDASDFSFRQIK